MRMQVCTCMHALSSRVAEDGVTLSRTPPAACQGWRFLPRDLWLSCPNCSQASKIKSPWDTFAEANPAPAMRHKLHNDTFMTAPFFLSSFFSFLSVLWPLENYHNCFLPHSLISYSTFSPLLYIFFSCLSVVLFFCFLLLISMVTVHFPGIMEARE